jgi:hypothetical protein
MAKRQSTLLLEISAKDSSNSLNLLTKADFRDYAKERTLESTELSENLLSQDKFCSSPWSTALAIFCFQTADVNAAAFP